MMSVALRMMQGASSITCSKAVITSCKQDTTRVFPANWYSRGLRSPSNVILQRRGEQLHSLIAQAVRSDQQVPAALIARSVYYSKSAIEPFNSSDLLPAFHTMLCSQVDQLSNAALELISEITRKADEEHAATLERNRATLEGLVEQEVPAELKRKVLATVTALKEGLLERETEVRKLALSEFGA